MNNMILKFKIPAEVRFECPDCGKSFATGKGLAGHKKIHMKKKRNIHEAMDAQDGENGEKTLFSCPVCQQGYASEKALHGHMRKHPDRGWRGMRPPPEAEGSQPPNQDRGKSVMVENPLLVNNNKAPILKSKNNFPCEKCGKCFKTYQALGGHMSHHEGKSAPPPRMEQPEGFAGNISGHGQLPVPVPVPVTVDEGDKGNGDQPARVVFDFDLNELPNGDEEY